jgi:hypothetical protein
MDSFPGIQLGSESLQQFMAVSKILLHPSLELVDAFVQHVRCNLGSELSFPQALMIFIPSSIWDRVCCGVFEHSLGRGTGAGFGGIP